MGAANRCGVRESGMIEAVDREALATPPADLTRLTEATGRRAAVHGTHVPPVHTSSPAVPNSGDLTSTQAKELTEKIRTHVVEIWPLIVRAYEGRAWLPLGYASWDMYCDAELRGIRPALERGERQERVGELRQSGLSIPAIASAVGASVGTVHGDLKAFNPESLPTEVTGSDGKRYDANKPSEPEPEPVADEPVADYRDSPQGIADRIAAEEREPIVEPQWTDEEDALFDRMQAGETVVVSLRGQHANLIAWAEGEDRYVRIDRRTEWGNPFELPGDGDRETVIRNYEAYYLPHKPSLLAKIETLRGKALGCWCAPEACHGDALKRRANAGH